MRILFTLGFTAVLCAAAPAKGRAAEAAFATKPFVKKAGDKYIITFAAKAACDAAVSIVGPDGKVVRHLAAGVLGPNAPAPFVKGTLSQRVEWDGLDNAGKPAPRGCKVRVGLGLTATLEKALGFDELTLPPVVGLGCGADGTLYVLCGTRWSDTLVAISREGKYLRTLMPWPTKLPAERLKGARIHGLPGGRRLPVFELRYGNVLPQQRHLRMQVLAISPGGKVAFLGDGRRETKGQRTLDLITVGTDGSVPAKSYYGPKILSAKARKIEGAFSLAAAPDGKTVYATAGKKVYRMPWSGEGPAQSFGPGAIGNPACVAVDAKGQVYIADEKAGKILVLKPDGSQVRSIACANPKVIAVHPASGNLYVLSLKKKSLVKLSPDGKQLARLALGNSGFMTGGDGQGGRSVTFALDASAEPPVLWVGNPVLRDRKDPAKRMPLLWRVEDKGASFEFRPVGTRTLEPEFLSVDRARDEVYVRHGCIQGGHLYPIYRYSGATGEGATYTPQVKLQVRWRKAFKPLDFDMGPDGHLYIAGHSPTEVLRLDRDGKRVPFPGGADSIKVEKGIQHGGMGSSGIDVSIAGDIYVGSYTAGGKGAVVHRFGADGKSKKKDLVVGLPQAAFSVRGGRDGAVYVNAPWKPGAAKAPLYEGILGAIARGGALDYRKFYRPDLPREYDSVYKTDLGMIVKFPAGGGALGNGEKWRQPGMSPIPGRRHIAIGRYGCTCQNGRFDLDGFDRVFSPDGLTCGVNVFDSAGNTILRIGRYGNRGDLLAALVDGAKDAEVPLAYPVYAAAGDDALYVSDTVTMAVVRLKLGYEAQEELPLP